MTEELENQYNQIVKRIEEICFKHNFSGLNELADKLEKSLKALEIIKKYTTKDGIEINFLQFFDFDGSINEEAKKELDLLKEVLR